MRRFGLLAVAVLVVVFLLFGLLLTERVPAQQEADPGAPGPFAVATEEYDYGDFAYLPPGLTMPVELRAAVYYPADLSRGPFPLVLFMHGNHAPCFKKKRTGATWPCERPLKPLPSYRGFAYVAERLASHGFVVASISANGAVAENGGVAARVSLIGKHLELWKDFATTGAEPFGTKFVSKIDLSRIGTIGHSAGGQAVVDHYRVNAALDSPFAIRAVFAIAPIYASRPVLSDARWRCFWPIAMGTPNWQGSIITMMPAMIRQGLAHPNTRF